MFKNKVKCFDSLQCRVFGFVFGFVFGNSVNAQINQKHLQITFYK